MATAPPARPAARPGLAGAAALSLAAILVHLFTNRGYGYFRDELYLLACTDHLDWGYVDHAPLIDLIARIGRSLLGDSLAAIRFFPALAAGAKVLLTGLLVRELGGGRFAVMLACLCVLLAPIYLGIDTLLSMNAFEPLFWMGCVYCLLIAMRRPGPHPWVWLGVLAGLGLQNKHSMMFFGFALVAAMALAPERRFLRSRWFWLAGALAALIFLPNVVWQVQHGWPTLEDLSNVRKVHKNVELAPPAFFGQQVLMLNPVSGLVWLAGLGWLLFSRAGRRYRVLGFAYLLVLGLLMALKGKNYYLAPAYPMLFAAGGVFWEQLLAARRSLVWARIALPGLIVLTGAALAPMVLPVLPVEGYLRYQQVLGFQPPRTERGHAGPLPQHFGDMFGWPEMVEAVARIYHRLPPEERARCGIFASNYGEAGAIDFFGPRHGLPKAISPHQNYFFWGPREYTGEVLIVLQRKRESLEKFCGDVQAVGEVGHPYAMAEEHYTIFLCRNAKEPLQQVWPRLKHWN